jgi:hypothetical protein
MGRFVDPPPSAAWRHRDSRSGFEVAFFTRSDNGLIAAGETAAVQDGQAWLVGYRIELDGSWGTRRARVWARSSGGVRSADLETNGDGRWLVDGRHAGHLDGCMDLDLESSALTNAFPVHRLALGVGKHASAPAAYLRAVDLTAERLEQSYMRVDGDDLRQRYDYEAPAFDFSCRLIYDEHGLVVEYPGIAERVS